jgi:hypothetical protein
LGFFFRYEDLRRRAQNHLCIKLQAASWLILGI